MIVMNIAILKSLRLRLVAFGLEMISVMSYMELGSSD